MDPVFQPMPGFTAQQTVYIQSYIWSSDNLSMDWRPSLNAAFNEYFGLPPLQPLPPLQWYEQCTPPAPQAKKEEDEQQVQQFIPPAPQAKKEEVKETRPKPLYQATVEDDAEDTPESTKHGNSMLTSRKSYDSKQLCRKWTPHTGLLATSLASSFGALFGRLATFFFGTFLASQLGYIEWMEGMEASGEG